ncbi:MAG: zinc ribbon domain-containing protein [Polyangia bacterium]
MPIYEYECHACGHQFEEWQKMSDDPVKVCPKCKEPKVEKLISHTSFQLKGSGWYSDLYASKKPSSPSGEASTVAKPGSSGAGASASSASSGSGSAAAGGSSSASSGGSGSSASSASTSSSGKDSSSKGASTRAA